MSSTELTEWSQLYRLEDVEAKLAHRRSRRK